MNESHVDLLTTKVTVDLVLVGSGLKGQCRDRHATFIYRCDTCANSWMTESHVDLLTTDVTVDLVLVGKGLKGQQEQECCLHIQ